MPGVNHPFVVYFRFLAIAGVLWGAAAVAFADDAEPPLSGPEGPGIGRILQEFDLSVPSQRDLAVMRIRELEEVRREDALARAREMGLPLRVEFPDDTVKEIALFDQEDRPVYFMTHNDQAAISTGADLLHGPEFGLDGEGVVIGMWDGGSARAGHQEFSGGRMVVMDGASPINHATHVGGTLAAAGVVARAKGMAYSATVESYDWNNDKSEMTSRAATGPDESDALYLSNHSYGYVAGWLRTGGSNPAYIWYGSGSTASSTDPRFGQYNSQARDSDVLAYNAPYYLMFRSAGNDRNDNPSNGQTVQLSPGSTSTTTYDLSIHPPGDGVYRGGYDTISFDAIAKNVITVGAVTDAVSDGARDPSQAVISSVSSWGPTDDGRIKPDIVANGVSLYSTLNSSNTAYGNMSGTSMSAPNAAGTAALLIQKYSRLFPGDAMRASTLKGLLIHTADDLGTPGPNYQYGWGLLNGEAAAELIRDHAEYPLKIRMGEHLLTSGDPAHSYEFVWDGGEPIRVTLAWTDPAGSATTGTDNRTPRLRNNLDVRVVGPDGSVHYPYVMPFVGAWTEESMSAPATTGINNTDNVEQVFIASPPAPGVYRAEVGHQGTLTNNQQYYSLLVSGSSAEEPPPPALSLSGVSPDSAASGDTVTLDISGTALSTVIGVELTREGFPAIPVDNLRVTGGVLRGEADLAGAAAGQWSVVAVDEEESASLDEAFTVVAAIYSENFDGAASGWISEAATGSNSWILTDDQSHTPPNAYFASAPSTKTTTWLISPSIDIPETASNMQLRFWHDFDLQSSQDGGRLEISTNDGSTWFGVEDDDSGVTFASNGYNTTIGRTTPNPRENSSEFQGQQAWSGDSNGFIETIVNFNDSEKFAGQTLRFRWGLATNASVASPGWYVDSIVLTGEGDFGNEPPVIVSPASTAAEDTVFEEEEEREYDLVPGDSVEVFVSATDDGGPENLTYTWASSGPAPVFFMPNGDNSSDQSTAHFEALGDYELTVTVTDAGGLSVTSTVSVRVTPSPSGIEVQPRSASLAVGESLLFSAVLLDQFDQAMAEQPDSFQWSATGGGAIDETGLFLADTVGDSFTISASTTTQEGEIIDYALVSVIPAEALVALGDLVQVFDGSPKSVSVSTEPDGLPVTVTYDGEATTPVDVGSYAVLAVVDDPNYQGSAEGTLVIEESEGDIGDYATWRDEYFGEDSAEDPRAAPEADPDGDGWPNWAEFYLETDPTDPRSAPEFRIDNVDTDNNTVTLFIRPAPEIGGFFLQGAPSPAGPWGDEVETEVNEADLENGIVVEIDPGETFFRLIYRAPPVE